MPSSVLIVDDEENFLLLLDWILTKEGFHVTSANDASRALHLLDKQVFDLIILDTYMFPADSIRLLSELKKRSPSIPVIMITAYPAQDIHSECVKNGADALLTKPINIDELKKVAQSLAY
jgi:two-component system NtrC family response regulator